MAFADARKINGHHVVEVTATERVSPHMVRVTVSWESLHRLPVHGFD